jgi:hypothetical protein
MRTQDIIALKNDLQTNDSGRHDKYEFLIEAMGGDYETRRLDALWSTFQQFIGKFDVPLDRETFEFRLNLLPSIIRASRSFISNIPQVRCPPADPSNEDSRAKAEKLERVYQGFWQDSHIGRRMNQVGYWNPTLGNAIGVVWPNFVKKRPELQIRSPFGFYPVLRDVDGFDIKQAVFVTSYPYRTVAAMHPSLGLPLTQAKCEVVQYMDESEIVTVVDGKHRVKEARNTWGFVPCVIICNESWGEGPWGESDIEWVIPLQAERNYRSMLQNALLNMMQMQPVAIEGGDNLPENIPMGALDAIPVEQGGKVYRVNPPTVPFQVFQAQEEITRLIDRVGQVPQVMRGEFEGNVMTGKGVSALQGPTTMAYNIKGNEIYPALAELNKMAMRMWERLWPGEHTVYGMQKKGGMFVERFNPTEFDGWFENIVSVDLSSYLDVNTKFIMNLQAVQNRLKSRQLAASETPGVEDYVADQKQVMKEMQEDMDFQLANQARAQNQVNPDMGAQGATNYSLSQGFLGETPPPEATGGFTAPTGAPEEGQPEAEGGETSLLEDLIEFFESVKLRGRVWLAGNVVTDPTYSAESPNWNGIEVFLEEPGDKSAILTTLRKDFPEAHGNFVFHNGAPNPQEPSLLVYDPNQESAMDMVPDGTGPGSESGMPSGGDLEALMGGMPSGQTQEA